MHLPRWRLMLARGAVCIIAAAWPATTDAIEVARLSGGMTITQQLQLLRDGGATHDLPTAMASQDWQAISVPLLQEGYSTAAFWLRGSLYNAGQTPVTRWLALGSARLQDVRLYLPAGDGALEDVQPAQAGTLHPLARRALPARRALFPVTLAPGERRVFVLRVAGESVLDLGVAVWEPFAFRREESHELAIQSFVLGVALLLVIYALVQGVTWRDRGFLLMAAWIVAALAYICSFQGYLYVHVMPQGGPWIVKAPATLGCLATLLYLRMSYVLVALAGLHGWRMVYRITTAALLLVTVWTALGNYRDSAPVANATAGLAYLVWLASMLHGWWRRLDNARLLVLSFALAWLGMSLKLLELNGLVDHSVLPDWHFATLFQLGLMCMTGTAVIGRALELHRKHEQMQWAMLYMRAREQLKLEQAVAARTRELREALRAADEANQAKTGFLTRISHDLRTPLTSILGFADMLQAGGGEHARHGRIIVRSARHMLAMINDLIDYARGDRPDLPQPAAVYVHALLHDIAQEGAALARGQHNAFHLDVSAGLPPVLQIDARRLRRILGNLLDNAAKYTRDGQISLRVRWQTVTEQAAMGVMEMQVQDTGRGIPLHYQARVFEPFERAQADHSQPGIGMGLAIVRQWTQQMGGRIQLESQPGRGTTMTLRLPAALGKEEDIARHDVPQEGSRRILIDGAGRLVMVVEDSPDIAHLLAEQLDSMGFVVESFADGETAISRIMQPATPSPALVLSDYLLPGAGGDAVLRASRHYLPGVPVLLLSATLQPERSGQDGPHFDACLLKPVNFMELQEAMAQLLGLPGLCAADAAPSPGPLAMQAPSRLMAPPQDSLQQALDLIAMGAVSDLFDWCEGLLEVHPQCADFQRRVRQLLRAGDLSALEALCRE